MAEQKKETNWQDVFSWLARASQNLKAGQIILEKGWYPQTISKAYYVMFYSAYASLLSQGLPTTIKTHRGLIAKFSENLIKNKKLPKNFGSVLSKASFLREKADYDVSANFTYSETKKILGEAEKFLNKINEFVNKQKPKI